MSMEYVIKEDGGLIRRDIVERELEITQAGLEALGNSIIRRTTSIYHLKDFGPAHIALGAESNIVFFTVELKRIPLRAPFKLVKESTLVPQFGDNSLDTLSLEWEAPEGMSIRFLNMCTVNEGGRANQRWHSTKAWLFAGTTDNRQFRLPLPNIYDDCRICEGEWVRTASNGEECLLKALTQFEKSEWNADLWRAPENTQSMFRFTPNKEGFTQMAISGDWTNLSFKVGTDVTKWLVIR